MECLSRAYPCQAPLTLSCLQHRACFKSRACTGRRGRRQRCLRGGAASRCVRRRCRRKCSRSYVKPSMRTIKVGVAEAQSSRARPRVTRPSRKRAAPPPRGAPITTSSPGQRLPWGCARPCRQSLVRLFPLVWAAVCADGNGSIDLKELKYVMSELGAPEGEAERALRAADTLGNGVVTFPEVCCEASFCTRGMRMLFARARVCLCACMHVCCVHACMCAVMRSVAKCDRCLAFLCGGRASLRPFGSGAAARVCRLRHGRFRVRE